MNYALDGKKRVAEAMKKEVFWSKEELKRRDQMTTIKVWILICRRFWLNYRRACLLQKRAEIHIEPLATCQNRWISEVRCTSSVKTLTKFVDTTLEDSGFSGDPTDRKHRR